MKNTLQAITVVKISLDKERLRLMIKALLFFNIFLDAFAVWQCQQGWETTSVPAPRHPIMRGSTVRSE